MRPGDEEEADETEIGALPRAPSEPSAPAQRRACLVALGGPAAGLVFALTEPETYAGCGAGTAIRLRAAGISRLHARFLLGRDEVEIENVGDSRTLVNGAALSRSKLRDGDRIELGEDTRLLFTYVEASQDEIESNLFSSTSRDLLTGAWTRRRLLAELERELSYIRRHGDTLTLLVAAPTWPGHRNEPESISRAVILAVADRIRSCLGQAELFSRWSETAFAIFVRSAEERVVAELSIRIAQSVTKKPVATDLGERQVSLHVVPIGASSLGTLSVDSLMAQADAALGKS